MKLQISSGLFTEDNADATSMRCPLCGRLGSFEALGRDLRFQAKGGSTSMMTVGHRVCPNPTCRMHVFIVVDQNHQLQVSYPPERIDFDPKNVPADIVASMEEAITCRANECFIASAIMVRKTLELLCAAQNVSGDNPKARIKALGAKAIIPQDLFAGLDDLRLLGNDAAHIESKEYAQISHEEIDVAIEFTKEVLKAVYQYSDMLTRLRALKRQP